MRRRRAGLLLIEFFPAALRRNEKSMLFPFLQGLARGLGWQSLWLCFGGDTAPSLDKPTGRSTLARLCATERSALKRRLAAFGPSRVVTSDILSPETAALLDHASPPPKHLVMPTLFDVAARGRSDPDMAPHATVASADPRRADYLGKCGWFLDWLGCEDPALAGRWLVSAVEPDYSAVPANEAARRAPGHITLVSGSLCADRHKLSLNPLFKGLDLGSARFGCSFCSAADAPWLTPPGEPVLPLLEKQLEAIRRTAGPGKDAGVYEFYDFQALWRFDEVFSAVLALKLPPSVFLFNPRIDDVLRLRGRIEKVLPGLAGAGHQVRFLSMGVENFSQRENARLNKGIALAQVDEFLALVKDWEARFPGVVKPFKAGHDKAELGLILFTPWTTLEDVRLNLERARERGFPERGYWLYSTLLIRRADPIHALAEKDGVLTGRWPDPGQIYGQFKNEGEMGPLVPWRFQDERTAAYYGLLVRVCAADREGGGCAFFRSDPAFDSIRRAYAAARRRRELRPLGFAFALLSLLEAGPGGLPREALLRQALEQAPLRRRVPRTRRIRHSPRASAVARACARLAPTRLGAAAKLTLLSVEDLVEAGERPLRLTFAAGKDTVVVDLFDRATPGPFFLFSRRLRAVRHGQAPEISPEQSRFLALMLRLAEKS